MKRPTIGIVGCTFLLSRITLSLALLTCCASIASAQERRIPGQRIASTGSIAGVVREESNRPAVGVTVEIRASEPAKSAVSQTNGEGIYRFSNLPVGAYSVTVADPKYSGATANVQIRAAELQVVDFVLKSIAPPPTDTAGPTGIPRGTRTAVPAAPEEELQSYPVFRRALPENSTVLSSPEVVPNEKDNFLLEPYRWTVEMPAWQRYGKVGEFPYVKSRWYDPFNRNRIKGDTPLFGQHWFLNFTGTSVTGVDTRRLPTPSNVAAENPGSTQFFGRGEQAFADQQFRLSFDLFRGDTSFRPVDFRARFTPVLDLNFLQTLERGIVYRDVRAGTNRFDTHTGIQEAFVEAKIRDLSPNFDFVSIRVGIQGFSSDFRGFIFADEEPGIRVFGNLKSNRFNYNLAYFYNLEKDTNSGLNTFEARHQQVGIANVYVQDFFAKGYTTEFSFHYNYDQGGIEYDKNGFLVRPAPIGAVVSTNGIPIPHAIRSYYLGWTGNGHIKRLNVSNAFYQVLGTDSFSSIAGRPEHINAQMGALELSYDKDWLRYRASIFWASGDDESRIGPSRGSSTARGFDSILDDTHFAGGQFSFFDREGIRLTGTGVALVTPFSLLPSLRSSKDEGQSNFVNPGIRVYSAGLDADLTPKLRGFLNVSYLQFDRTETLSYLLFQSNVHRSVGTDTGLGISYRPPLAENIVLTAGVSSLVPGLGLRNIYNSRVLVSAFANIRFQF